MATNNGQQPKNPMLEMERIIGPKSFWPKDIKRLIFLKHRETPDQIIKILAFAYVNGVKEDLLVKVFQQLKLGTAYFDFRSAIYAQYHAWNYSKDLRGSVKAFCVKRNGVFTLNYDLPWAQTSSMSPISPYKSPQKMSGWSPSLSTPTKRRHEDFDFSSQDILIEDELELSNLSDEFWSPKSIKGSERGAKMELEGKSNFDKKQEQILEKRKTENKEEEILDKNEKIENKEEILDKNEKIENKEEEK